MKPTRKRLWRGAAAIVAAALAAMAAAQAYPAKAIRIVVALSMRATLEGRKRMQFAIDRATRQSCIDLEELAKMDGVSFKSHY